MIKRNIEIDRLRAICIILIVYCHFGRIFFPSIISMSEQYGTTLAEIFFVISGYVISKITIQKIDDLKKTSLELAVYIKAFYFKRICRLYPAAWTVFFSVLIGSLYFNESEVFSTTRNTIDAGIFLITNTFNYFFIDNYASLALSPYWTLAIEEQFYFAFPLFLVLTKTNRQRIIILLGMLFAITFFIRPLTMYYYPIQGLFYTQTRCDGILYGCLIYFVTCQPWYQALKFKSASNKTIRCVGISLLVGVSLASTLLNVSINFLIPLGSIIASILVLLATFKNDIIVFPTLLQKTLDLIGLRSFSLYLVHVPTFLLASELGMDLNFFANTFHINIAIFAVILLMVVTELLYRLIEKPTHRLSEQVFRKMNAEYQIDKDKRATQTGELASDSVN